MTERFAPGARGPAAAWRTIVHGTPASSAARNQVLITARSTGSAGSRNIRRVMRLITGSHCWARGANRDGHRRRHPAPGLSYTREPPGSPSRPRARNQFSSSRVTMRVTMWLQYTGALPLSATPHGGTTHPAVCGTLPPSSLAQSDSVPSRCRAMTMRWISDVPSPISHTLASRIIRSTG